MPSKPEDFRKIEDKFKLSLLQLQKRLTDLEVAISEVKESVKVSKAREISELAQRVEDIEDLIMVEQAGIVELQKMMQAAEERFLAASKMPKNLKKRVEEMEGIIKELEPVKDQFDIIKNGVDALKNKLNAIEKNMETGVSANIDFLTSRIDALKKNLAELRNESVETKLKIEGLEKSIAGLENSMAGATPAGLNEKLDITRKELRMLGAKLESVETVIKEITVKVDELEVEQKKFGSFKELSIFRKEIEDKVEEFKSLKNELSKMSSRMEMLYSETDKKVGKLKDLEKGYEKLSNDILALAKEVDKNRITFLSAVKKDELSKLLDARLEEMNARFEEIEKKRIKPITDSLDELYGRHVKLEEEIKNKIVNLDKIKSTAEEAKALALATESGVKNVASLEKIVSDMRSKIQTIEENISKKMETLKATIDTKIGELKEPSAVFEAQINELIDRIVFLESRLAAVEARMQKLISEQPIILE